MIIRVSCITDERVSVWMVKKQWFLVERVFQLAMLKNWVQLILLKFVTIINVMFKTLFNWIKDVISESICSFRQCFLWQQVTIFIVIKHVRTNVSQTTIRWHGVVIVRRFNYLRKQSWYMCICIYFVESTICSTRANVCVRPSPRLSFMTIPIVICSVVVFLFIVYALVHYLKERRRPTISTTSIDFRRLRDERFNDSDIWKKITRYLH